MSRLFLNALGMNNALGNDLKTISEKVFSENPQSGLTPYIHLFSGRTTWVGNVNAELPEIPNHVSEFNNRNNQLILHAYEQIEKDVQNMVNKYGPKRVGVILGTSTSGIAVGENEYKLYRDGEKDFVRYRAQEIGNCAIFLSRMLGLNSIFYTVSTACSSSKKAMMSAQRLIQAGLLDAAIVGGSDTLCQLTVNGFDALDSVSPQICNPLSKNRRGINIGEGAALFLMSRDEAEISFLGVGESSDGYHISSPEPTGSGAKIAIRQALKEAQLLPEDIGYINLHGTATPKNDEMESNAVNEIFGLSVPVSSTKPLIGHTLGAAGAQELGFCYMMLSSQWNSEKRLPMQLWDGCIDEALKPVRVVERGEKWFKPTALSNSFAFGGNNACIVLGKS